MLELHFSKANNMLDILDMLDIKIYYDIVLSHSLLRH